MLCDYSLLASIFIATGVIVWLIIVITGVVTVLNKIFSLFRW